MAIKRKFVLDTDTDADDHNTVKQLKLIPFPNYEPDPDAVMFDSEPHLTVHTRLDSFASFSSDSTNSPSSSPFPPFDQQPLPFFSTDGMVNTKSHEYSTYSTQSPPSPGVRLLQPSSDFFHHGTGCSQIPKLRLSCAANLGGRRTMWSHCEQCGAISMVDDFEEISVQVS